MKHINRGNPPESLILALVDKKMEAKLRTICYRLKEKGKTKDYANDCDITYLDLLQYGLSGITFTRINELLER
jgi:hypothetical protein